MRIKRGEGCCYHTLVFIVLICALAIRLWGIEYAEHTDEYNEVLEALRVDAGYLNYERWGKKFYLYLLAIEYGIYYVAGWFLGAFSSPLDFASTIVRNMQPLFLLGRLTSAVFGVGAIFLVYLLGERLYSKQVGLLAAFTLTLTAVHIEISQHARLDATLLFVTLLSFYFITLAMENQEARLRNFLTAGFLLGIAFQAKIYAVILVFPLCFAYIRCLPNLKIKRQHFTIALGVAGSIAIGLVVGNPAIVFAVDKFVMDIWSSYDVYTKPINVVPADSIGFLAYPTFFANQLGFPLLMLCIVGILYASIKRSSQDLLALTFIVPFYVLIGSSRFMVASHYMVPALPFLYFLAWRSLEDAMQMAKIRAKKTRILAITVLACVFLFEPIANSLSYALSVSRKNTRYVARDWIEDHIPYGSKILMDSGKSINSFAPAIAENKASLERTLQQAQDNIAKGIIIQGSVDKPALVYYKLLLKTIPKKSYDITSTGFGLDVKALSYYLKNNYDYLVITGELAENYLTGEGARLYPRSAKFYKGVFSSKQLILLKEISPSKFNRGNTYFVFKVRK